MVALGGNFLPLPEGVKKPSDRTRTLTEEEYQRLKQMALGMTPTFPQNLPSEPPGPDLRSKADQIGERSAISRVMMNASMQDYVLVRAGVGSASGYMMELIIRPSTIYDDPSTLVRRADFELILSVEHDGLSGSRHTRFLYDFPFSDKNVAGLVYRALGEFIDVMGVLDA